MECLREICRRLKRAIEESKSSGCTPWEVDRYAGCLEETAALTALRRVYAALCSGDST